MASAENCLFSACKLLLVFAEDCCLRQLHPATDTQPALSPSLSYESRLQLNFTQSNKWLKEELSL